jgi:GTP cyclohydrolase I
MDWQQVRAGVVQMMAGLGCDLRDPNFIDTPDRIVGSFQETLVGLNGDRDQQVAELLTSIFPCEHQQMVVANHIEVFSMCPHHFLPVHYDISVGYLPGPDGKVLGLSKMLRLTKLLAARPVLQEQMVNDVTEALMRIPGCIGAGCIARGEHLCIRMRGVKQSGSVVVTSSLTGNFLADRNVTAEFMTLVNARPAA